MIEEPAGPSELAQRAALEARRISTPSAVRTHQEQVLLQLTKVFEEAGEVAAEVHTWLAGQTGAPSEPPKGLRVELGDLLISAGVLVEVIGLSLDQVVSARGTELDERWSHNSAAPTPSGTAPSRPRPAPAVHDGMNLPFGQPGGPA